MWQVGGVLGMLGVLEEEGGLLSAFLSLHFPRAIQRARSGAT